MCRQVRDEAVVRGAPVGWQARAGGEVGCDDLGACGPGVAAVGVEMCGSEGALGMLFVIELVRLVG